MLMDAGWDLFNRICFNYPTLGVLYQRAAYDAGAAARARERLG
jgi:NAD(P) transhydrogenase